MIREELSMLDTFPACVSILERELRPLHYSELTKMALAAVGKNPAQVLWRKEIENVREKLLCAGQRGTFYIPSPFCMGALRHWFKLDQLSFNLETVVIPGNASAGVAGGIEAWARSDYMEVHNSALKNTHYLKSLRVKALVLEKHVSEWFRENYPEFYSEPDNHGNYERWCNHDFKLSVYGKTYRVDVAGPDRNGDYGHRGKKPKTDVHLLCRLVGKNCLWDAVVRGDGFSQTVIPETATSPTAFLVWLNCAKNNIPYPELISAINNRAVAA